MKILVTGGPVHAKIDAVKKVTNGFKGGLMAKLANELQVLGAEVFYLCSEDSTKPSSIPDNRILLHDGFWDYYNKAINWCLNHNPDAVVLGAAVANLIPVRFQVEKGGSMVDVENFEDKKFPSHNWKPNEKIFMEWQIAPRLIDVFKNNPDKGDVTGNYFSKSKHVFGFKLLANVAHDELIGAAYEVLLGSRATAVFANDRKDLKAVYAVTKERGEHPMARDDIAKFIVDCISDEYYATKCRADNIASINPTVIALIERWGQWGKSVEDGHIFGSVAVNPCRYFKKDNSCTWREPYFVTTTRHKKSFADLASVVDVDHVRRTVSVAKKAKASLNAPLFAHIFDEHEECAVIVHAHVHIKEFPTLPYAPPGTVRDSQRKLPQSSFNIEGHGCFLLLNHKTWFFLEEDKKVTKGKNANPMLVLAQAQKRGENDNSC